jgi:hypothetical protein
MKGTTVNTSRLWGVAAVALLACAAGVAPAQAPSWGEAPAPAAQERAPDLTELIRSLDSEQWARRQGAEDVLREALGDLATLEEALSDVDFELSREARRRLIKLGEEVFQRSPRPGVGISFTPDSAGDGVRIDSTVRGFDADEHLRRGDVIVSFGGIPTPNDERMRTAIMVHDPEDVVEVAVRRDNEIVPLQLRLGWFRDLNPQSTREPDRAAMRRAWAMRAARHLNSAPPEAEAVVIEVGLEPALWQSADVVTTQARTQLDQRRRPKAALVPEVAVAGSPIEAEGDRAGAIVVNERRRQIDAQVEGLTQRISALEANLPRFNGADPRTADQIKKEIDRLRMQLQQYQALRELDGPRP